MTVLVIGQIGQLAQSLVAAASVRGMPLVTAGRPQLDLLDADSVGSVVDAVAPSFVINAAAYTAVDKAETEPDVAHAINAKAVEQLAQACSRRGIGLLHVSTDYVFNGRGEAAYRENDPVGPINAYGRSKLAGEELLRQTLDKHLVVRTAWVHSPYGSNFLKTMLRLATSRPEVSVVSDQLGNPTYAPHLAVTLLEMVRQVQDAGSDAPWGTYHATGDGEASWYEFASAIFDEARRNGLDVGRVLPITAAQYPTPAARPANSRLDCSLLRETFGLALPHWRVGTEECVKLNVAQGR